jgi:gamma-glutamyltranspeptidase / glutathione hydrolase
VSAPFVDRPRPVVRGRRGVVSCGHPLGVSAALEALVDGGNAVDAACAAAAALCVVLPNACGLGGDALILIGRRDGGSLAINGNGAAPAAVPARIPPDGGGTAAVPGLVAALVRAHEREGRLPRERVLSPAVDLASGGFPVGDDLRSAMDRQRERLQRGAASWALADPRLAPGDVVRLPRLADLLAAIASDGAAAFYGGAAAEAIAAAARAGGGAMQAADLHAYDAQIGAPVCARYAGVTCETSPPTSQGILLLVALRWLERLKSSSGETSRLHQQVRAIEECFAFRSDVARKDAAERLLADSVLDEMSLEPGGRTGAGPLGYHHTTAIAVADSDGLVVSALISVFDDFGSATLVPELDIVLNNRLLGFDAEGPNAPAPGRRPVHTLSPALVRSPEALTAIATPGADGQVQTLLQVLSAVHEDGVPLQEALHGPRWRVVDGSVALEEGFDPELAADLEIRGHAVVLHPAGDELFGGVAAATSHAGRPGLTAASDPRRETWAGGL